MKVIKLYSFTFLIFVYSCFEVKPKVLGPHAIISPKHMQNYDTKHKPLNIKVNVINITIPKTLPVISRGNYTVYIEFQRAMLDIKLNRIQAKELFHIVDLNDDKVIQSTEWANFYDLFAASFFNCDEDNDLLLSREELSNCMQEDTRFENMIEFNSKWVKDTKKLMKRIFKAFDLNGDNLLNFFDYISLRNFNNAYDVLLVKEGKAYINNFAVGIHMITRKIKFYNFNDFQRIFNRTLSLAYFPHEEYMDFATFSTLGHFFKLFINGNHHTGGFLSYADLLTVGQTTQTYQLLQNYTQLFVKNDFIYKNLNKGTKMGKLIYLDKYNFTRRNFELIRDNTDKISIEQIFLLYRHFETLTSHNIKFPFTFTTHKFAELLTDKFFANFTKNIANSYEDFKAVVEAAEVEKSPFSEDNSNEAEEADTQKKFPDKSDYLKFLFRIMDLNNSTFIEIYELLLVRKVYSLYSFMQEKGKILNNANDTSFIKNNTGNFSDYNVLTIDRTDEDYLVYLNYKFNPGKINFHQFLFLYLNRLRDTTKLISPEDITIYLNYFGFYISNSFKEEFYTFYDIKSEDFLSYALAVQKYFEFYSDNLK